MGFYNKTEMRGGEEMVRREHPFHMYSAILKQPEAVRVTISENEQVIQNAAQRLRQAKRIFMVGIGSSYHAAKMVHYIALTVASHIETYTIHSFDFAYYTPKLNTEDCVIGISHRGTKIYTVEALRIAKEAGCLTIGITGESEASPLSDQSNVTIHTVAQELSSAHTISFVSSIAVLTAIFTKAADEPSEGMFLLDTLPRILEESLLTGQKAMELALSIVNSRRIWLVGGGTCGVVAKEIALKIKETSYLQAEGMSVEEMIHGPFQCVGPEDMFIVIGPCGKTQPRVLEMIPMIESIGAKFILVDDGSAPVQAKYRIVVPKVAEHYAGLVSLMPLQLLTYQLALENGTNPDSFRLNDARFREAAAKITL